MNQIMSDQIDQLATALAKAQAEMEVAGKNQKNPFFKSNYADFEAIINASRPALTKNGLSVIQSISEDASGSSCLITILMHSSGQWIKSKARHNPPKSDIQSLSSYNTYLKRMCYTSLVGVATGDDDDGEAAVAPSRSQSNGNGVQGNQGFNKQISSISNDIELVTPEQAETLDHSLQGYPDFAKTILDHFKIDTFDKLPKKHFTAVLDRINKLKQI